MRRGLKLAAAAIAAVAVIGYLVAARAPSYAPPEDDEIRILLELAGVFPDSYDIAWREHGMLRSSDPEALRDPDLLRGALFMHNLTTGAARSDAEVYVETSYSYFAHDRQFDVPDPVPGRLESLDPHGVFAKAGTYGCWCASQGEAPPVTDCHAVLSYGNYSFSLTVDYNKDRCMTARTAAHRREEFLRTVKTADQLIHLYLEPLRRKPRWL